MSEPSIRISRNRGSDTSRSTTCSLTLQIRVFDFLVLSVFQILSFAYQVPGVGFQVTVVGCRVSDLRSRVWGVGCRVCMSGFGSRLARRDVDRVGAVGVLMPGSTSCWRVRVDHFRFSAFGLNLRFRILDFVLVVGRGIG